MEEKFEVTKKELVAIFKKWSLAHAKMTKEELEAAAKMSHKEYSIEATDTFIEYLKKVQK